MQIRLVKIQRAQVVSFKRAPTQVKGKRLLPHVLTALQNAGHNPMRLTETTSEAIVSPLLRDLINQLKQAVPVVQHVNP